VSERCAECGYDYDTVAPGDAIVAVRSFARRYRAPLTRFLSGEDPDDVLRRRPDPATWSALEYAAHVRDVFALYQHRIRRALIEDHPRFRPVDPDAAAADGGYAGLDPATVADELAANAESLAVTLDGVEPDDWTRAGLRDGEELSVLWMARQAVHEGSHHLLDIGRVLRTVRGR
jgi:hypothetical protein